MKTTKDQRKNMRRDIEGGKVLSSSVLLKLLDDYATLEHMLYSAKAGLIMTIHLNDVEAARIALDELQKGEKP